MHPRDVQAQHQSCGLSVRTTKGVEEEDQGTDFVLGFSIGTVLQQQLNHLHITAKTGSVKWCMANLWNNASP